MGYISILFTMWDITATRLAGVHFVPVLTQLGPFWIIFVRFWPNLDRFWTILGHFRPFSSILGRFWSDFDQFWCILDRFCTILEYFVPIFWTILNDSGPFWTDFDGFCRILAHFVLNLTDFGPFGSISAGFGPIFANFGPKRHPTSSLTWRNAPKWPTIRYNSARQAFWRGGAPQKARAGLNTNP